MKVQRTVTVARDVSCLAMGLFGIGYQIVTGKVNEFLLAACIVLTGLPGALGLAQLRTPPLGEQNTPASSSSSPPPSQQSQSSSSS